MNTTMKHVGDYYIKDNKIYAVTKIEWERRFERCNSRLSIATTVSYRVETPIIEEVTKKTIETLLKDNENWLQHLVDKRKDCACNIEYEANDSGQWKAHYAINKFTELLKLIT
jgi:hypothetical protein